MIEFREVTAEVLREKAKYLRCQKSRFCDYTPGIIHMWRGLYRNDYTVYEDVLIYKALYDRGYYFSVPICCCRISKVLDAVEEYAKAHDIPLRFWAMTEEGVRILRERYGADRVQAEASEDWADYLYRAEDIRSLAGRKYAGQRNHINRFKKEYGEYAFEPITADNLEEAKNFFDQCSAESIRETETAQEEDIRARELLDYLDVLKLDAGVIRTNGKIVGLSIGERFLDTLYVHVERADRNYLGSYQVLVQEFARYYADETIQYINREEDDGQEGLRRSKQSYHPCELLQKYAVEILPE